MLKSLTRAQALAFDIRKGAHSVGSSVRDSASYVLWALVRAQSVEILAPHLLEIALRLVTTSLFDREVHVRRAASAAYQEAVGRTVRLLSQCLQPIHLTTITAIYSPRYRCLAGNRLLRRERTPERVSSCGPSSRRVSS